MPALRVAFTANRDFAIQDTACARFLVCIMIRCNSFSPTLQPCDYYRDPLLAGRIIKQQRGGESKSARLGVTALGYSVFRRLVLPRMQSLDRTQL